MQEEKPSAPRIVRFGVFEVGLRAGELRKGGVKVKLEGQPFQILALLLERPGEVVTREELKQKLWPADTFVDFEHSINAAVKRLREALDDSADTPRFVETLPRRGYRFIYPVEGQELAVPALRRRPRWVPALALVALPGLLALLLALNVGGLRDRLLGRPAPGEITSIAVLPLENLSRDPEQDYFADGMTEALITELGKISALRVISRQSTMQYKATKKSVPEIARELKVDAVVEGAALRSGDKVRISAQLIQAVPERHLWAESYERDLRDILALQSQVARAITREIQITLTPQEQVRLTRTRPVNPEVYEAYLKGRYYLNSLTADAEAKAIKYLNQAVEKEPGYALAYAGLAEAYLYQTYSAKDPKAKNAKDTALKAVALDDALAEAHTMLGLVRFLFDWDWSAAETELKRAVELNPNSAVAHDWYAVYLMAMRRFEEALLQTRRARDLDPLSPVYRATEGFVFFYLGQYDRALDEWQSALDISPNSAEAHADLGLAYLQKGMYQQAAASARKAEEVSLGHPIFLGLAGYVFGRAGRKDDALRVLNKLGEVAKRESIPASCLVWVYAGLGQKDEAFRWLEKAYQQREYAVTALNLFPQYDLLRDDPRFQDLLRRMNFPP